MFSKSQKTVQSQKWTDTAFWPYTADLYCLFQQTQNICIKFIQRRPIVFDVGPTLYKYYTNV